MKKLVISILVAVGAFLAIGNSVRLLAEDELIDLYPYDNPLSMVDGSGFTGGSIVGTSNWKLEYNGYRYHAVRSAARYAKDFADKDMDGLINAAEMNSALSWNAFGSIIINDTEEEFVLSTENGRTDLTTVVHRVWTYFDQDGNLELFEDQINQYYVINEGTNEENGQEWRLANEAEIARMSAEGYEFTDNEKFAHIRLLMDDNDTKGYKLEPITYITWKHIFAGVDGHPETIIMDTEYSVDFPIVKPGYTVFSFGTIDRDGQNRKTVSFIKSLPYAMTKGDTKAMKMNYENQGPDFAATLAHLDKDPNQPGINFIVEYAGSVTIADLTTGVKPTFMQMYDGDGNILAKETVADYQVLVYQDEALIETIDMVYDTEDGVHKPSGELTKIDTKVFGAKYDLVFKSVSPVDGTLITEKKVDLVVGVFPPRIDGVPKQSRYVDEGEYVDLLEGITGDNGYGENLTSTIKITTPPGFSQYNPSPGTYDIKLDLAYNVIIRGLRGHIKYTVGAEEFDEDYTSLNTQIAAPNGISVFQKEAYAELVGAEGMATMAYGSMLLVIENNKVVKAFDRFNNHVMDEENPASTASAANAKTAEWFKELELTDNQYAIVFKAGAAFNHNKFARAAKFGDDFFLQIETETIDEMLYVETSYTLVVEDRTPPTVIVLDNNYTIEVGQFDNANDAIRANLLAFDNFSNTTILIRDLGGLDLNKAGTYTVQVEATDDGDNKSAVYTFKITVKEDQTTILNNQIDALNKKLSSRFTVSLIVSIASAAILAGGALGAALIITKKKED